MLKVFLADRLMQSEMEELKDTGLVKKAVAPLHNGAVLGAH